MSQYDDLKRAAEACAGLLPIRYMESHGSLFIRNDYGIVFDVHQNRDFPAFMAANKAYADLVLAATPAAVLALIAENTSLKGSCMAMGKDMGKVTRERNSARAKADQLKAEVEALRKALTDVHESVQREYWDEYAGLEETRAILDAAIGKGAK
jgi:type III secretory pathway component EscV